MLKSTLDLKASVTRRTPATPLPSDMAERLAQLQHHQTAEALATVDSVAAAISDPATPELEPAPARDPETEKSGKQLKREAHALQFGFLSACLGKPVTVFLINGIRLTGKLRQYDQYCILLEGPDALNSMIFKHACASIVPATGR